MSAAIGGAPRVNRPGAVTLLHLRNATDFERVRRAGRSHAHPLVVLIARQRGPAELTVRAPGGLTLPDLRPRFGFVAGKAVGVAVARNRAKRLLREAVRATAAQLVPGWDVVLIARRPLAQARLADTQAALAQLLRRAHLLAGPHEPGTLANGAVTDA